MIPEANNPRPFSLSGPHCRVSLMQLANPSEGNGPFDPPFAFPLTRSAGKVNVTASGPDPSGSIRTAPVPSDFGPAYTRPLNSKT